MKTLLNRFALISLVALFSCIPCHANPILLVLGDSLSAAYRIAPEDGWVALLENKLKMTHPDAVVINSSIVGDTTANGLDRLPALLNKYQPTIVIIEMGGNDGLRGLSTKAIRDNLNKMIAMCLQAKAKVFLMSIKLPPNYGSKYRKEFYDNYVSLSEDNKIVLVPFPLEEIALKQQLMFEDRIHPNREAQPIILEYVWPYLSSALGAS